MKRIILAVVLVAGLPSLARAAELPKAVTDPVFATNGQVLAAYGALTDLTKPHLITEWDQNGRPVLDKDGKRETATVPYHFSSGALIEALTRDKVALRPAADAASDALSLLRAQYAEKHKKDIPVLGADGRPDPTWNPLASDPGFITAARDLMGSAPAAFAFGLTPLHYADFNVMQNDGIGDDIAMLGPLVQYSDQATSR